jgi:hypothetical protein
VSTTGQTSTSRTRYRERLVRLVEQFSQVKLGNKEAEPDVLGNV